MRFLPLLLLAAPALAHSGHGADPVSHALDHAALIALLAAGVAAGLYVWARR